MMVFYHDQLTEQISEHSYISSIPQKREKVVGMTTFPFTELIS